MKITQETARKIWACYDEISKGEKLLADMQERSRQYQDPNPRDPFGRQRCLQLGIPMGDTWHILLDVQPKLAMAIITAHIAESRSMLVVLNETAKSELEAK